MIKFTLISASLVCLMCSASAPVTAQQEESKPSPGQDQKRPPPGGLGNFQLSSSELTEGGELPDGLKCTRHGGDGLSPPLEWVGAPDGTESFAIVMHHYSRGKYPGLDSPSHYWLVWNIPASATGVKRGNPDSLGSEGSDKDNRGIGYTPPCSPEGSGAHNYTITVYAVDGALEALPKDDDPSIVWDDMMAALKGHVLNADSISFTD